MTPDIIAAAACRGLSRDQAVIVTALLRGVKTVDAARALVAAWDWSWVCERVLNNLGDLADGKTTLELEMACEQETDSDR